MIQLTRTILYVSMRHLSMGSRTRGLIRLALEGEVAPFSCMATLGTLLGLYSQAHLPD